MGKISLKEVLRFSNLFAAWEKVKGNQGCAGVDHVSLADFERDLQSQLSLLQQEVRYETYQPLPLFRVHIDKPDGGLRPLSIPPVRDRVLQTAVARIIEPLLELEFEDVSFAYRKGRSVNQAVARVEQYRDEGYRWVVDADIKAFFDQVDRTLLMDEVKRVIQDEGIRNLIRLWLDVTIVDGKKRYKTERGLPQGSPISPMLANLYLDHLDESLLDENLRLIRFADDFVILCNSENRAQEALELTSEVLEELRLHLNRTKTQVVEFNAGFRFLGVEFIRSLAFKAHHPEPLERGTVAVIQEKRGDVSPPVTDSLPQTALKNEAVDGSNTMAAAFADAGIDAKTFPSEVDQLDDALIEEEPESTERDYDETDGLDPRLKTLYLLQHGSVLGKEDERFTVRRRGEPLKEILAIHVDQIMVFGNSQITTQAMQLCLQRRIPVYLLSGTGKFYGVVDSFDTEPVLLHREQFLRAAESDFCLKTASQILSGKIANSRLVLKRMARHREGLSLTKGTVQLKESLKKLSVAKDLDQLRGYEGSAAKVYFKAMAAVIGDEWNFSKRIKRPPTDPVNAMLSYGYTLLFYNMYTFIRASGLNPHVGYLHPIRMGHPALASDLMEEFRSIIVDSVVVNLVLNNKLQPADFSQEEEGGPCMMSQSARKIFINQMEAKMNASVTHPATGFKLDYRRCIEQQVKHFAAVIRGQVETYRPMVLR